MVMSGCAWLCKIEAIVLISELTGVKVPLAHASVIC